MPGQLDPQLQPEPRWNTHLACLQRIADAASRGLDLIAVAGLTGIAFRTALCAQATPSSLYLSWAWEPQFRVWFDSLGLDAEITAHASDRITYEAWLMRQADRIAHSLDRGFPVIYWDNSAFGLILGADQQGYQLSGIPRFTIHPHWFDDPATQSWAARSYDPQQSAPAPIAISLRDFTPAVNHAALFAYPQGVTPFDPERAAELSLVQAYAELAGQVEFPRWRDNLDVVYQPQFGAEAYTRLRRELAEGAVHHYGLVQFLQALTEARICGWQYFKRLAQSIAPPYAARVEQLAQFFSQVVDYLRPLGGIYHLPLDEKLQLKHSSLSAVAEALYQVQQAEQTARRVLAELARDITADQPGPAKTAAGPPAPAGT